MSNRIKSLDTVKGISILGIVLYHLRGGFDGSVKDILWPVLTWGGDLGNTVFFLLSGFMITRRYGGQLERYTLGSFVVNRLRKIYPTYLLSTFAMLIILVVREGIHVLNSKDIALNLLLITTGWVYDEYPFNIPCWFLSVLLLQYIIWYITVKSTKEKLIYFACAYILLGLTMQKLSLNVPFFYYHTGEAMVPFFEGVVLFLLMDNKKEIANAIKLVSAGGMFLLVIVSYLSDFDTASGTLKFAWYFFVVPTVVLSSINVKGVRAFLEIKPIYMLFGNIGFAMFFWHAPLIDALNIIRNHVKINISVNAETFIMLFIIYIFSIIYMQLLPKLTLFIKTVYEKHVYIK